MFDHRPPTKVSRGEASTYPRVKRSVRGLKAESWFKDTVESIRERESRVREVTRQARELLASTENLSLDEEAEVVSWVSEMEEEQKSLSQLSEEYVSAAYQDQISSLPQYSVMAGTRKKYTHPLGTSTDSTPITSTHWKRFCYTEPQILVRKNPHLHNSSLGLREEAVDFVVRATLGMGDEEARAKVIDVFVSNVERLRRQAVRETQRSRTSSTPKRVSAPDSLLFD